MEYLDDGMPDKLIETKPSFAARVSSWWRSLGFISKLVAILAVSALTLSGLAVSSMQTARIAEIESIARISDGSYATPPQPPSSSFPQPSTVSQCMQGVIDFSVMNPCSNGGFRNITFTCANGSKSYRTAGPSEQCLSLVNEAQLAENECTNIKICPISSSNPNPSPTPIPPSPSIAPSPTIIPVPSVVASPIPTRLPSPIPSGCRYQAVQCVKAPCEPILVCQVPTPTPSATLIPYGSDIGQLKSISPTPTLTPTPTPTPTPVPVIEQVRSTVSTYLCRIKAIRRGTSWSSTKSSCN